MEVGHVITVQGVSRDREDLAWFIAIEYFGTYNIEECEHRDATLVVRIYSRRGTFNSEYKEYCYHEL